MLRNWIIKIRRRVRYQKSLGLFQIFITDKQQLGFCPGYGATSETFFRFLVSVHFGYASVEQPEKVCGTNSLGCDRMICTGLALSKPPTEHLALS